MLIASRSKSIRERHKVLFVYRVQHLDDRSLYDLVLQRRHTDRPLSSVRFRDVNSHDGLCSIRSSFQPSGEVCEVSLEGFAVVLPRFAIDAGARVSLEGEVRGAKAFDIVDVVKERSEPLFPVLSCSSTCPLQRAARVSPALRPEHVALERVSLCQVPFLHPLRYWSPGFVRGLPRY